MEFKNNGDFIHPNYVKNNDTNVCDLLPTPDNNTEKYEYNATDNTIKYRSITYSIIKLDSQELHLKSYGSTTIYKKL